MALNYEKIMAYRPADIRATYGPRDCMLYAFGIGLGMDPLDQGQLKFVDVVPWPRCVGSDALGLVEPVRWSLQAR